MNNKIKSARYLALSTLLATALSGCYDTPPTTTPPSTLAQASLDAVPLEKIFAEHNKTPQDKILKEGIESLLEGNHTEASQKFNTALFENPSSTWIHYLNGLNYHLMARGGDQAQYDLARAGYEQALKFDPTNTLASLQLGRVHAEEKRYVKAQEELANVLLIEPANFEALYELASVSYKMGDIRTARMAIERAQAKYGTMPEVVKARSMILAASGKGEEALVALSAYKQQANSPQKSRRLEGRLRDWQNLYKSGLILAQASAYAIDAEFAADAEAPDTPVDSDTSSDSDSGSQDASSAPAAGGDMIIFDAVVLRVSNIGETSKGNNILENLTLSLAPGTHYRGKSNSGNTSAGSFSIFPGGSLSGEHAGGGNSLSTTKVFTQGISFGTLSYSMNLLNSGREYIEVVGRPSLVASVGVEAKFFSGKDLALGLTGQYGGNITKLPVGVTLKVKPTSFDGQSVTLDVTLFGSLIPEDELGKDATKQFTSIGMSSIRTTIKTKLGETVMLAGITERIDTNNKNGVPLLGDIPGIQYLFSKEKTFSERKSVMYLITPRAYSDNKRAIQSIKGFQDGRVNLSELELRNKDWYAPDYNMAVTMQHLAPLYREFRHGDIDDLNWYMPDHLKEQVKQAMSFLYY